MKFYYVSRIIRCIQPISSNIKLQNLFYYFILFYFAAMSSSDSEEDNKIAFVVEGVILLIIGLVGIFGNVSAIVVFSR